MTRCITDCKQKQRLVGQEIQLHSKHNFKTLQRGMKSSFRSGLRDPQLKEVTGQPLYHEVLPFLTTPAAVTGWSQPDTAWGTREGVYMTLLLKVVKYLPDGCWVAQRPSRPRPARAKLSATPGCSVGPAPLSSR